MNIKNSARTYVKHFTSWGAILAVGVTFIIYFGSQIFAGALMSVYGMLKGWQTDQIISWASNSTIAQFSYILIVEVLTLYFLFLIVKYKKISLKDIGLNKPKASKLVYAIPAYFIYFFLLILTFTLVKIFLKDINFDQAQEIGFQTARGALLIIVFFSLVILPAFAEEILIRGFLYGGFRKNFNKLTAAIIASFIFALAHLQIGSGNPPLWTAAIDTFILSMVLVGLREKTGSIWAGVIVHMIKNSIAFLSLFVFVGGF